MGSGPRRVVVIGTVSPLLEVNGNDLESGGLLGPIKSDRSNGSLRRYYQFSAKQSLINNELDEK
jgi:hypothetical protein